MKKKIIIPSVVILAIIGLILFCIPYKTKTKVTYFALTDDISKFDEVTCYDDGMSYYAKWDMTIKKIDIEKILFFYKVILEYEKGNLCDYEFYLEEEYILDVINNAKIEENEKNINLRKLIEGKTAIEGNKRYPDNDYETYMSYTLNGEYQILYVYHSEDLLVIQVGHTDEGAKYIAYK